ncbi:hypothetical protein RND71_030191 [Anisodus tanguticus]|uniref:DUF4219 domain-containing protein n=1 Tax=Anisodus tanguticus TaxID=243964 RepID=A0AAE1RFX6_9SOLA|nr:hypothetical protein RND71_030191 [Anisodus tanguticus]
MGSRSAVLNIFLVLVFVGWLFIWVMLPTKTDKKFMDSPALRQAQLHIFQRKNSWIPQLLDKLNSTSFREGLSAFRIHPRNRILQILIILRDMANCMAPFQVPILNNNSYDNWSFKMKAFLGSQDVWDIIEKGYNEPANDAAFVALTSDQKTILKDSRKRD